MNLKNSWKEFRILARWIEDLFALLMKIVLFLSTALIIIFPRSVICFILFLVLAVPFAVLTGFIMIIGIDDLPRNWRLVLEEAKRFKEKYGQGEKVYSLIASTQQTKNGSRLYDFMTQYELLEEKKQQLAAMQHNDAEILDLMFDIKILIKKLEHI